MPHRVIPHLLITTALCATVPSPAAAQQDAAANYVQLFDRIDQQMNDGAGYSNDSNAQGLLAWGESYILQSYVQMYRATGETRYLDRLIAHFDRVLANRDDRRGVSDHYRQQPIAGWGAEKYSPGVWHVWGVHTGLICLGAAEFVRIVRGDEKLQQQYAAKADEYLARIKESLHAHDPDWHTGPADDEGYYTDPHVKAANLPLNMSNGLGLVLIELSVITGEDQYRDRAQRLARYFKNRLRKREDGSYDWAYWPPHEGTGEGSEDVSHAGINVLFAVRCHEAGIVFDRDDMDAFAKTWLKHVRLGNNTWADDVGGTKGTQQYMPGAMSLWLDLSRYEPAMLDDGRRAYAPIARARGGPVSLGIAKLARWERELTAAKRLEALRKQLENNPDAAVQGLRRLAQQFRGTLVANDANALAEATLADPQQRAMAQQRAIDKEADQLLQLAENYIRAGRSDLARPPLQRIIDEHPNTAHAAKAQKLLEELKK